MTIVDITVSTKYRLLRQEQKHEKKAKRLPIMVLIQMKKPWEKTHPLV